MNADEVVAELLAKAVTPRERVLVCTVRELTRAIDGFCQLHRADRLVATQVVAAWDQFVEAPTGGDEARDLFRVFRDTIATLRVGTEHSQAVRSQIADTLNQYAALIDLDIL